jgi:hypothetical protein
MANKDKTGGARQSRLREARIKWLKENAYGLSAEGLIGALMRGECSLSWASVPTKRAPDAGDSAASQTLSPQSGESTPEVEPAATQRR